MSASVKNAVKNVDPNVTVDAAGSAVTSPAVNKGSAFKKLLAFGSGVGIAVEGARGEEFLRVVAVRVRPNGAQVLREFPVENFHNTPAAEWGTAYNAAIGKLGMRHVAAIVLLPRQDVILRQVAMPGVLDQDLDAALAFQLEGLHPWGDDAAVEASWARLGESGTVVVAMARREVIDRYITVFAEAGIKLAGFTCSAPAIYSALRIFGRPVPAEILACETTGGGAVRSLEVYGESSAKPLLSATFPITVPEPVAKLLEDEDEAASLPEHVEGDVAAALAGREPHSETEEIWPEDVLRQQDRALAMAAAELRIENLPVLRSLKALLGVSHTFAYAAALSSACPRLSLSLNLLPADQRQNASRWRWVPTAVLGTGIAATAAALALLPGYQNARLLATLNQEIARVQPAATRSGQLDQDIASARARTLTLDRLRGRSKADMDVLAELTRLLPPPAWVRVLEITEQNLTFTGQTNQADPLLKVLDESPLFEASEFNSPPTRADEGESFRIRAKRSERNPAKPAVENPASAGTANGMPGQVANTSPGARPQQ